MIVAKNIHKFYENKHILKGIDIKIEEGEIVSLIGSSGAGKTTLLQILSTIEKFQAGYDSMISLNGINLYKLNKNEIAKLRNEKLGFIFQFHELLPEFTVIENICIPAFIKGISKKNAELEAEKLIDVDNLKALDPCCGSGTFITRLIGKVIKKNSNRSDLLQIIVNSVKH